LVLSVLIAAAFAAPRDVEVEEAKVEIEEAQLDETEIEIEKAQMPFYNPMLRNPWMTHNNDMFPIDYSEKDN
jgi:hypothetical protein